jgi:hypothetical protein
MAASADIDQLGKQLQGVSLKLVVLAMDSYNRNTIPVPV